MLYCLKYIWCRRHDDSIIDSKPAVRWLIVLYSRILNWTFWTLPKNSNNKPGRSRNCCCYNSPHVLCPFIQQSTNRSHVELMSCSIVPKNTDSFSLLVILNSTLSNIIGQSSVEDVLLFGTSMFLSLSAFIYGRFLFFDVVLLSLLSSWDTTQAIP